MLPIWGKISRADKENAKSTDYYYSASSGEIVSSDGTGYVIPFLSDSIVEKLRYIPFDVARDKVESLTRESNDLRQTSQQNISKLHEFYQKLINDSKQVYENQIYEMKTKALRHVEIQKQLRNEIETKLTKELKLSEDTVEELRDSMAHLNVEYQEEVRNLKARLSESEKAVNLLTLKQSDFLLQAQCKEAVSEMVFKVELENTKMDSRNEYQQLIHESNNDYSQKYLQLEEKEKIANNSLQNLRVDFDARIECERTLKEVLWKIETDNSAERNAALQSALIQLEKERENLVSAEANATDYHSEMQKMSDMTAEHQSQIEQIREAASIEYEEKMQDAVKDLQNELSQNENALQNVKTQLIRSEVEGSLSRIMCSVLESQDRFEGPTVAKSDLTEGSEKLSNKVLQNIRSAEMESFVRDVVASIVEASIHQSDNQKLSEALESSDALINELQLESTELKRLAQSNEVRHEDKAGSDKEKAKPPVESALLMELRNQLEELQKQLTEMRLNFEKVSAEWETEAELGRELNREKDAVKTEIKEWSKAFQDANDGKEPGVSDKAKIKDKYQKYKLFSVKSKEVDLHVGELARKKEDTRIELEKVEALLQEVRSKYESEVAAETIRNRKQEEVRKNSISEAYVMRRSSFLHAKEDRVVQTDISIDPLTENASSTELPSMSKVASVRALQRIGSIQENAALMTATLLSPGGNGIHRMSSSGLNTKLRSSFTTPSVDKRDEQPDLNSLVPVTLHDDMDGIEDEDKKVDKVPFATRRNSKLLSSRSFGDSNALNDQSEKVIELINNLNIKDEIIGQLELAQHANIEALEALEDQLHAVTQEHAELLKDKESWDSDRKLIEDQLEALIKEKRTDVIKRYEAEVEKMRELETDLKEKIAAMTADKVKSDARIKEFKDRAELAEQEIKDRDAREQALLNPTDEKFVLKQQINKQRDAIVLKSKAATAGWDAAAHSDERLDVEVEKAYKRGLVEEREVHKKEMEQLNAAIELKETRITELLVSVHDMELKFRKSTQDQVAMQEQMEQMKLDVADTIAGLNLISFVGGSQSVAKRNRVAIEGLESETTDKEGENDVPFDSQASSDIMIGPTQQELDNAREELDNAQEELLQLTEKCDKLEEELNLAQKKNRMFEKLSFLTGASTPFSPVPGPPTGVGMTSNFSTVGLNSLSKYDLAETINQVKKTIVKGTNLWKSNRRDECFDLYLSCCMDTADRLLSNELKGPLLESTTHGKAQGLQNKQRGAVVLRKALDKFLIDAGSSNLKTVEESAEASVKSKAEADATSAMVEKEDAISSVTKQINAMDQSLLEQGYTSENNPTVGSKTDPSDQTNEGGSPANPVQSSASLLHRARTAEEMVKSLKRQLAAVISATAKGSMGMMADDSEGDKRETDGSGVVGGGKVKNANSESQQPSAVGTMKSVQSTVLLKNTGANNDAEIRRLNRKIKELEAQLKSNAGSGGGGSGEDKKAMAALEKQLQKKIKDLEAANKKETKALEMRAVKAENALSKIQGNFNSVAEERDQYKNDNLKFMNMSQELANLKEKSARIEEIERALAVKENEYTILSEQFKKETALRKKYKNELEDLKGAIRVYARCRPMAKYEKEKGCKTVVEIKDENSLRVVTTRGDKDFEFDAVFGQNSTQDQVFEDTKRLVESCLDGFNVCLFAYGQTGSGKTFTMTGTPDMPGLTPKAIDELYRLIWEKKHCQVKVTTYFVELYNDNLVDLYWVLDNKNQASSSGIEPPKLEIKMDAKKMIFIRNSVIKDCSGPDELMELFNKGNLERHTGATKMNAESSRSHSIFSIMVECYDTATKRTTNGKLSLVDLAGSERADKTGASADRLKEAQSINKSLSALGDVIAALSTGEKFIPYRNNKLTQLMQDSLGGNAKTLMFVNFSPADYNADETSTSLMYAARVKKIVNNASKQAESEEVAKLKQIIKKLQAGVQVDLTALGEANDDANNGNDESESSAVDAEQDNKIYDGY